MTFHEVLFPPQISYGSAAGSTFSNIVITSETGHSTRIRQRDTPLRRWEIRADNFPNDLAQALWSFAHARHGSYFGFRYFDWTETSTSEIDPYALIGHDPEEHATLIGELVANQTIYPLFKTYRRDFIIQGHYSRRIFKPLTFLDQVWMDVGTPPRDDQTEFGKMHWFFVGASKDPIEPIAIDYEEGVVTFSSASLAAYPPGTPIWWSGYFAFPARFTADVDEFLARTVVSHQTYTFDRLSVVEDLSVDDGDRMLHTPYPGGATVVPIAAGATWHLQMGAGAMQILVPAGAGAQVRLPIERHWMLGGPVVVLANGSPLYGIAVKNSNGQTLTPLDLDNLPAETIVALFLTQSGANLQWRYSQP